MPVYITNFIVQYTERVVLEELLIPMAAEGRSDFLNSFPAFFLFLVLLTYMQLFFLVQRLFFLQPLHAIAMY
jgi:hypothetical protein